MVDDGEGDLLYPEISESIRLKELYEERLKCLLERDPRLALVREGRVDLYARYEAHFHKKIIENTLVIEAAREVLNKWRETSTTTTPAAQAAARSAVPTAHISTDIKP